MAESAEDIIIIEESDASSFESADSQKEASQKQAQEKKKKILLFGALGIAVVLVIIIIVLLLMKSKPEVEPALVEFEDENWSEKPKEVIEPSKLEAMITKANYLYSNGSKEEALHLYEKIAIYSEAISVYNLGVAQLKNAQYETALETFKKAILNDEKRCVSAINAAVCSLHLKDSKSFDYYIELAYAYLPKEINSPLYSYYYALINYYKGNYFEALSALKNPTSGEYADTQKHLSAKINALFSNNQDAIASMEKDFIGSDAFSLGLLYANIGDLTLAKKHLQNAIQNNIQSPRAGLALGLIYLKSGEVASGGKEIKNVTDMFPEEVYKHYPIKVMIKDSLFEPKQAQNRYRKSMKESRLLNYQKIFYFSPYKMFNAQQTIDDIKKGTANIFIDNIDTAEEYLKKSASSSSSNKGIIQAIKKALSFKIREANYDLQQLVKIQPKHSILHYNLALTYAQMGNMIQAHDHFVRSYNLDAKNYLSGVYAIMTGQLINKENPKLQSLVKDSIMEEAESETIDLYKTLFEYSQKNLLATSDWLEKDYKLRPLYLALNVIIATSLNKLDIAEKASQSLIVLLPHDILPHLMYIDARFAHSKPLDYASEVMTYLKLQTFHFDDLYFGPNITRYLYIQQNLITGQLYFLREQLKKVLEATQEPVYELTSALALACLYDKAFEESYTLYNQLIDELKVRDAQTLFHGGVASIGAGHHDNAIALFELSKMKDTNFLESRYALGLLYMEVSNNEGASIQFTKVGDNGFTSEFFNFEIDTNKLLFEKQHLKQ